MRVRIAAFRVRAHVVTFLPLSTCIHPRTSMLHEKPTQSKNLIPLSFRALYRYLSSSLPVMQALSSLGSRR